MAHLTISFQLGKKIRKLKKLDNWIYMVLSETNFLFFLFLLNVFSNNLIYKNSIFFSKKKTNIRAKLSTKT